MRPRLGLRCRRCEIGTMDPVNRGSLPVKCTPGRVVKVKARYVNIRLVTTGRNPITYTHSFASTRRFCHIVGHHDLERFFDVFSLRDGSHFLCRGSLGPVGQYEGPDRLAGIPGADSTGNSGRSGSPVALDAGEEHPLENGDPRKWLVIAGNLRRGGLFDHRPGRQ